MQHQHPLAPDGVCHAAVHPPVSLLRLSAAAFSESAPNVATIISKVFFSIDTISIFMQLSVMSNQIAPNEYAKEYGNVYGCQYGQYGKSAICI